ncbi:MAG: phosphotransferase, partial [Planctomycetota bacterium]
LRMADGARRIIKMAPKRRSRSRRTARSDESVAREPDAYRRLAAAGLPAPRIHCGESASGHFGRAWFVCDDLGRRTAADSSGLSPTSRRRLYGQMGRLLAKIHATPVDDDSAAMTPLVSWQQDQIRRGLAGDLYRDDALSAALESLDHDTPVGRLGFCHGDFHAAQCIRRGGRLVAAVDWESAHIGDPGRDHAVFETMVRITAPTELAQSALDAYSEASPFFDAAAYADVRIAHAAALVVAFNDARRHAYARAARSLLKHWIAPIAAAA